MGEKIRERFGGRKGTKESTERNAYALWRNSTGVAHTSGENHITEPYLMGKG